MLSPIDGLAVIAREPHARFLLIGADDGVADMLVDALILSYRAHHLSVHRTQIISTKDWERVPILCQSMGLFDGGNAVIATSKHKPTLDLSALNNLCWRYALDKKPKTDLPNFINIDCFAPKEPVRARLVDLRAQALGLNFTPDAMAKLIALTYQNTQAAFSTLARLFHDGHTHLDTDTLDTALHDSAIYANFAIIDAMLAQDINQAMRILAQKPTGVLWALHRYITNLERVAHGDTAGIFPTHAYQKALSYGIDFACAYDFLKQIDMAQKGQSEHDEARLIAALCLYLTNPTLNLPNFSQIP